MIHKNSMPFTNPAALAAWQPGSPRAGGYVRIAVAALKRNHRPAQGCLPMTE
jgi:hypothetical protein